MVVGEERTGNVDRQGKQQKGEGRGGVEWLKEGQERGEMGDYGGDMGMGMRTSMERTRKGGGQRGEEDEWEEEAERVDYFVGREKRVCVCVWWWTDGGKESIERSWRRMKRPRWAE